MTSIQSQSAEYRLSAGFDGSNTSLPIETKRSANTWLSLASIGSSLRLQLSGTKTAFAAWFFISRAPSFSPRKRGETKTFGRDGRQCSFVFLIAQTLSFGRAIFLPWACVYFIVFSCSFFLSLHWLKKISSVALCSGKTETRFFK